MIEVRIDELSMYHTPLSKCSNECIQLNHTKGYSSLSRQNSWIQVSYYTPWQHSLPPLLPPLLLPLISLTLSSLLALNLRHKPLELLLVRSIPLLLLPQRLAGNALGILPQLSNSALLLPLVLLLQLRRFRALAVRVVVPVRVERIFELGDRRLDGQRPVVVQLQRPSREVRMLEKALQLLRELRDVGL